MICQTKEQKGGKEHGRLRKRWSQNYRGVKRSAECLEKKEKFNVIGIYETVFVASNNTSLSGVGEHGGRNVN